MKSCLQFLVLGVAVVLALCSSADAQQPYWRQIDGPMTGSVRCGTITPTGTILLGVPKNSQMEFNYYRSTDDGQSWQGMFINPTAPYTQEPTAFVSRPNGDVYLVSDFVYKSTDDGLTWRYAMNSGARTLFFLPDGRLRASGGAAGIIESTDGGGSWVPIGPKYTSGPFAGASVYVEQFLTSPMGHSVALSDDHYLWHNRPGEAWTRLKLRPSLSFKAVLGVGPSGTFYLAHRNKIYISSDGARFHILKTVGLRTREYLTAISGASGGEIFAGTSAGRAFRLYYSGTRLRMEEVMKTGSSVSSFTFSPRAPLAVAGTLEGGIFVKRSPAEPFIPAGFNISEVWRFARTNGTNLFALSQYSAPAIYRSTDEGLTWAPIATAPGTYPGLIGGTSKGFLFDLHCCGATIQRSADNGTTWTSLADPQVIKNDMYSFFETASKSILLGTSGGTFRSDDDGNSWEKVYDNPANVIHQTPDGTIYSAWYGVVKSTNNGTDWIPANEGLASVLVRSFASTSAGILFAATTGGVYTSEDAGAHWHPTADALVRDDLTQIVIDAQDRLYVSTGSTRGWYDLTPAGVFTSSNGGTTWSQPSSGLTNGNIIAMYLTSGNHLLAASERGGLFTNGPTASSSPGTAMTARALLQPEEFGLNQNYPNPFNPATTIEFSLAEGAAVTVAIYNTLGQQIAVLADNEDFAAGHFQLDFDAAGLSSGIYYYRLTARNTESGLQQFTSMKKMLLLK